MLLLSFILTLSLSAFAADRYGVYDAQGKQVSTFEAEPHELPEKTNQVKGELGKNLYVSSILKGKSSKPSSRYRYKAETGAYIEAKRKETFSICPEKEIEGTWVSEHSVYLSEENCLSIQAPNLAGTLNVLFIENSGRIDTIQVLVEQSYIPMGNYSHKVWIPAPEPDPESRYRGGVARVSDRRSDGQYENKIYEQPLIVDKTELTMGDAQYYSKFGIKLNPWWNTRYYLLNEDLKTSMKPYVNNYDTWKLANMRSKLEGLDTVYGKREGWGNVFIDTNATGYRLPFKDEWAMLMRAGASTRYYWGDEEDSATVSHYVWVRPSGYIQYDVAQKQPNAFGLYDMIGPNRVFVSYSSLTYETGTHCSTVSENTMPECLFHNQMLRRIENCKEKTCVTALETIRDETVTPSKIVKIVEKETKCKCKVIKDDMAETIRLLRKTPKLNKLEKF